MNAYTGTTLTEGQSGTSFASLTVNLSTASSQPVTVNYTTQDGTAQAGSDYVSTSNTLTFAPNQTTATIQIPVLGDTQVEANEAFTVNLSNPVNATLGSNSRAAVTINNDDRAALPKLSISGLTVQEGNSTGTGTANVTLRLSRASSQPVTVSYTTQDGTATAGTDYTARSGTVRFAAGETTKNLALTILGDTTVEPDETFQVLLSGAVNAVLDNDNSRALVTIINGDQSEDVAVTAAGKHDASAADVTYSVTPGNYTYTIVGFGAGDRIDFPADTDPTVLNTDFADGVVDILYEVLYGTSTTIRLTGLTTTQDAALNFVPEDFTYLFGAGTII